MTMDQVGPTHYGPVRDASTPISTPWWTMAACKDRGTVAMTTRIEHVECEKCLAIIKGKK